MVMARQIGLTLAEPEAVTLGTRMRALEAQLLAQQERNRELQDQISAQQDAMLILETRLAVLTTSVWILTAGFNGSQCGDRAAGSESPEKAHARAAEQAAELLEPLLTPSQR
jgi:hypothetical protein